MILVVLTIELTVTYDLFLKWYLETETIEQGTLERILTLVSS